MSTRIPYRGTELKRKVGSTVERKDKNVSTLLNGQKGQAVID